MGWFVDWKQGYIEAHKEISDLKDQIESQRQTIDNLKSGIASLQEDFEISQNHLSNITKFFNIGHDRDKLSIKAIAGMSETDTVLSNPVVEIKYDRAGSKDETIDVSMGINEFYKMQAAPRFIVKTIEHYDFRELRFYDDGGRLKQYCPHGGWVEGFTVDDYIKDYYPQVPYRCQDMLLLSPRIISAKEIYKPGNSNKKEKSKEKQSSK